MKLDGDLKDTLQRRLSLFLSFSLFIFSLVNFLVFKDNLPIRFSLFIFSIFEDVVDHLPARCSLYTFLLFLFSLFLFSIKDVVNVPAWRSSLFHLFSF